MSNIKVSIVIPSRNRCKSLEKTIRCLLNQSYSKEKYEILVCDDDSTDRTEEIVLRIINETTHNLKYFKIKSKIEGPAKVRNFGIDNAQGPIIGFTDDDCILPDNWIETAMSCFEKNSQICGVYGTVITFGNCRKKTFTIPRRVDVLEDNGSYVTPNVFYRKDVLLEVGKFDVEMRYMQDIELGWRVRKKGKIIFEPDLMVDHMVHCASVGNYFKRQRKYDYWVLMYSKHPENLKSDDLIFGHIYNKSVFLVLSLSLSFLLIDAYFLQMLLFSSILYIWAHVITDYKFKKYPRRILLFPWYILADFIRFVISLKASIKYRFLVLF